MDIGLKIKNLRVSQNLTQEELADRSELTKGFISQVERNLTSPSVSTLMDILDALGVNAKDFFTDDEPEKIVFKEEDYFENLKEDDNYKLTWIVPNAQKNEMEPTILELFKDAKSKVQSPFEGEILGYVIKGKINLHFDEDVFVVGEGETFYFRAYKESFMENLCEYSKVLYVSSPPNF